MQRKIKDLPGVKIILDISEKRTASSLKESVSQKTALLSEDGGGDHLRILGRSLMLCST
jgi:hypothetical protein